MEDLLKLMDSSGSGAVPQQPPTNAASNSHKVVERKVDEYDDSLSEGEIRDSEDDGEIADGEIAEGGLEVFADYSVYVS
jgi:hypothetical protein